MTALSLVFPVQNLITAVGVGFGIGINATIAYFLGAQKQEKADTSATLGVACSFLHGVLLTIGTIAIMPTFLSMFTKDQEVLSMGITYSRITFGFSIIISLGIAYEKIFQSVGRMKTTMFCMMSGCILNIILDPIMIFGLGPVPRMGIRGAAWATGLGQLLTLAAYLFFAWIRPLPVKISLKNLKFDRALLKKIYAVGIPATLNMALSSLLISSLNAILADRIQLRCRRAETGTQTLLLHTVSVCRNHACGNFALHDHPGYFTWTLYHQPADDRSRKHGTSYHQSGIYRIFSIHHFLRGTRRSGKRRTVSDDFALPLYDPDPSAGISFEPHRWTDRRLACVLDL